MPPRSLPRSRRFDAMRALHPIMPGKLASFGRGQKLFGNRKKVGPMSAASLSDYKWITVRSVQDLNRQDWQQVCDQQDDLLMDIRFLEVVESSLADLTEVWLAIGYERSRPVACAVLSRFSLDTAIFTSSWAERGVAWIRRFFPGYLKLPVLFCGLPVSMGENHLRISPAAHTPHVVSTLAAECRRIARANGCWTIIFKEFDDTDAARLQGLTDLGYLRGDSLPMNRFGYAFDDLDEFIEALRSHYRYKIRRSRKKFAASGLRVEQLTDAKRIREAYTPDVHRLYLDVEQRSKFRVETLPWEFFQTLPEQLPDEVSLTTIRQGERIVAFAWGLLSGTLYRDLFVGHDAALNAETDLYFNLMMHDLDFALRRGASTIAFGQTADDFKSRLGFVQEPRSIFVRGVSGWFHALIGLSSGLVLPKFPAAAPRDLFRDPQFPPSTAVLTGNWQPEVSQVSSSA